MNDRQGVPASVDAARIPPDHIIRRRWLPVVIAAAILLAGHRVAAGEQPLFVDVTADAGLDYTHGVDLPENPETAQQFFTMQYKVMAGGVAAGDYDRDGRIDLYVVRGAAGPNMLYRNLGNGRFEDVAAVAGIALAGDYNGPVFADYDGDGYVDLFIGGVAGTAPVLARNLGNGRFENVTERSGIRIDRNTFSSSFGDYDLDGDLDLFAAHWDLQIKAPAGQHLWRNAGDGSFEDVTLSAGLQSLVQHKGLPKPTGDIYTFGGIFADLNDDRWPDLLVAGDFNTSRVFVNQGNGSFVDESVAAVLTDENAMGMAAADYDNDGDIDWFVSSVFHGDDIPYNPTRYRFGYTGNRLYRNDGNGKFTDVTDAAGVRNGLWGWGACFADFNNDGHVDLFHVTGMGNPGSDWWREEFFWFLDNSSRLFMANGDGTFTEQAVSLGIADNGQGRGVVCFDYDRDGDVDILIANNGQPPKLYRNRLVERDSKQANYLVVQLHGRSPNTQAIGARVTVRTGAVVQTREIRAGTNYLSQDPAEAHFGLGAAGQVDEIRIDWPAADTEPTLLNDVAANQVLTAGPPAK